MWLLVFWALAVTDGSDPLTMEAGRCSLRPDNQWDCLAQFQIIDRHSDLTDCHAAGQALEALYPGQGYAECVRPGGSLPRQ